jgi:ubiquitin-conjugating enzyme E2 Z
MVLMDPLLRDNIYILHDEENIQISRACIIGPKDTPYEDGFYFFEFRFPDNYPFEPLKVSYYTNDGKTRMHPNFYACGKVCLSIIGTWSGPGWTSCQTLSSVLLTIQSLFINNPLHQEPGFENNLSYKNTNYNKIIRHQNIKIGIIQMIENIPIGFEMFLPILKEYLVLHYDQTLEKTQVGKDEDNLLLSSIWSFTLKTNYKSLQKKLTQLYHNILDEPVLRESELQHILDEMEKQDPLTLKTANLIIGQLDNAWDTQVLLGILHLRNKISIESGKINLIKE